MTLPPKIAMHVSAWRSTFQNSDTACGYLRVLHNACIAIPGGLAWHDSPLFDTLSQRAKLECLPSAHHFSEMATLAFDDEQRLGCAAFIIICADFLLRARDEATRAEMAQLINEGWPGAEALQRAMTSLAHDWRMEDNVVAIRDTQPTQEGGSK